MEVITKRQFKKHKQEYLKKIEKGAIFIYPTDTIYGIGTNAKNKSSVSKIRKIKQRPKTPFSVIAPSKLWIKNNCKLNKSTKKYLKKLPGKYTLILNLKNKTAIANNIAPNLNTIGIRIPKHWFSKSLKIPIVTTSVNITKEKFMTNLKNLNPKIKNKVDFIIYQGEKKSTPSKIIDLTKTEIKIKKR